jgi:deazaflavin-dependent oxidoreductase (nitroreductase family)
MMVEKHTDTAKDSATDWVAKHVKAYVESDGKQGQMYQGKPALVLTTLGRKSGEWRRTGLFYAMDGDDYVVVGSKGGSAKHPSWYLNLLEHPEVEVQVGAEKFAAVAHTATGAERERLWALMVKFWSMYKSFQSKTKRELPVVVLKRK